MNVFTFSGNAGRDAELRTIPSGTEVLNFAVAVNSGFGNNKRTDWVDCAVWGKRAQSLAPYIKKGSQVVVSGELSTDEYTSKQDGQTKTKLRVNVNEITLVGGKPEGAGSYQAPAQQAAPAPAPAVSVDDDDIPF